MSQPSEVIQVVAAAIVDSYERPTTVVAARRTEPPALAGFWELPGGKVESGEDLIPALKREIQEELGVTITVGPEITDAEQGDRGWVVAENYRLRVWLCQVETGVPAAIEDHDAVVTLPLNDMHSISWLESNSRALAFLAAKAGA